MSLTTTQNKEEVADELESLGEKLGGLTSELAAQVRDHEEMCEEDYNRLIVHGRRLQQLLKEVEDTDC